MKILIYHKGGKIESVDEDTLLVFKRRFNGKWPPVYGFKDWQEAYDYEDLDSVAKIEIMP